LQREEINRVLTDQIADLLFTTERDANENLLHEGVNEKKIHFVGNVVIDTGYCLSACCATRSGRWRWIRWLNMIWPPRATPC
jgi:hypothetical protein